MSLPGWLKPDRDFAKDAKWLARQLPGLLILLVLVRALQKSRVAWALICDLWQSFVDLLAWPSHHTWNQIMFAAVFVLVVFGIVNRAFDAHRSNSQESLKTATQQVRQLSFK